VRRSAGELNVRQGLPTGTVTFLFTDVEGSTTLLHELGPDHYAEALGEHRRVLREAFGRHGGVEVDTQGDAFFVAFPTAPGALEAAAEALKGLAPGLIRVRIGIHTGTPLLSEEGYVGHDVHRAARIAAAGHGGQVLLSQSTRALLETDDGLSLVDLGEHRLKDLSAAERIYQLGGGEFPPLRTLNATNLPVAANPLIGREGELTELMSLLRDSERLVTVTGPGGTGKTRFALQGAAELVDEFVDGVFWVPLQALSDARLVVPTVAQTLGAGDDLAGHLRGRRTLLLLDNLEHLLAAAPELAELLAGCADLHLLVTSRAPLRIAGEHELPLDPLPDREASVLFVERARDVGRRLDPDETVAAICRRLDNLPLALELAAARTKLLDAPSLLSRLEHSLPVLTGGRRDAPERQQTLRATIEWSYELLDEEAKRLFARLAVFAGSFLLEAAEVICDADLDALGVLVELSLLKPVGEGRFLMLETIAEFARERLEERGESATFRGRHAEHFLVLVPPKWAEDRGFARRSKDVYVRLAADYDNVRAALEWLRGTDDVDRVLGLATALVTFLSERGRLGEVRPMLEPILSEASHADPARRADALASLAIYAPDLDREARRQRAAEGLALARMADDTDRIQRALRTVARFQEDPTERRRLLLECEELARELDDPWSLGYVQMLLGQSAVEAGQYEEARVRLNEQLALFERIGDEREIARSLMDLGFLAVLEDRDEDSRRLFGQSVRGLLEFGATNWVSVCFEGLAAVALSEGDAEAATRLLAAAATIREESQDEYVEDYQRPILERTEAASRERLGPRFEAEWEAGKALTLEEAAALALGQQ
jgi:predicted ATPase/class 3 adenylate cyclase